MNLHQKLIEVRKAVPYLQKENLSGGNQYKYVSSSQVLQSLLGKMNELGVLLIPSITGHKISESPIEFYDDGKNSGKPTKRTTTYFTELDMTMTWVNADNPDEKIESLWYGQGVDIAGEKGVGKALTYAEKYFMLKFFNIATDKDDPDAFQQRNGDQPDKPKTDTKTESKSTPPPSGPAPKSETLTNPSIPNCQSCQKSISKTAEKAAAIVQYCADKFGGKTMCYDCQQAAKK